jgi:hypothetical protein
MNKQRKLDQNKKKKSTDSQLQSKQNNGVKQWTCKGNWKIFYKLDEVI